jgi:hypothetical protein
MKLLAGCLAAATLIFWAIPSAPADEKSDPWTDYRFLIGEWVGEGEGEPGKASASFTFAPDLDGRILVRKHRADVAAAGGKPAAKHEDLLIIYKGQDGKRNKAIYFDNEDHVIQYTATLSDDKKGLVFLSDPVPTAPRFRLTYTKEKEDSLRIKFEFAAPGKPDEFKIYGEGTARKKAAQEKAK